MTPLARWILGWDLNAIFIAAAGFILGICVATAKRRPEGWAGRSVLVLEHYSGQRVSEGSTFGVGALIIAAALWQLFSTAPAKTAPAFFSVVQSNSNCVVDVAQNKADIDVMVANLGGKSGSVVVHVRFAYLDGSYSPSPGALVDRGIDLSGNYHYHFDTQAVPLPKSSQQIVACLLKATPGVQTAVTARNP